jgi:dipeptidyl aminopeptidase/acylaminoacyl peptidase
MRRLLSLIVLCCALPIFAASRPMTADDLWKLKRVGPPSISPDGAWCVVDVTTWDVAKDDSSSNLWLLSTDAKTQKQLTNTTGKNGGPKWSPDGKWIAFTSQRVGDEGPQVYVIAPEGGEARRVSNMPMAPSGLKWSGDSKSIFCIAWTWPDISDDEAFKKKDKAIKESKSKAVIIDDVQFRYFDKWIADGKRPMIFAIDVETGKHCNLLAKCKRFLPPTEPTANDYDVSPDGKELCFVSDSAKEYGADFNSDLYTLRLDAEAEPKNITADNAAADTHPVYSPDGNNIGFLRQKSKHFYGDRQRLFVLDRKTGKNWEAIGDDVMDNFNLPFDRSISSFTWLQDELGVLGFMFEAEDEGSVRQYLVAARGIAVKLALTNGHADRNLSTAKSGKGGVWLRSSFDRPAGVVTIHPELKGNLSEYVEKEDEVFVHLKLSPIQLDHFNDDLVKQWKLGKVESMTFKGADDKNVQQWVVYPPDFDPKKKWPLIQVVHGGPHNGIMNEFSFRWNLQLWAAQGYVIGCVNFHGSSGFGQQFTDSITGDLGNKPLTDLMKSTDWFVKQSWIDKDRIAAAGASYGGYMMAWLNGHTDRFKAMVCHAGVYDWHAMMASDIVKGRERSLGAPPWENLDKVDRQSAQRYAANFKTPTLVLHGERDFRVPVTQGLAYYNTLRQKGVPARLVYFPDENHWVLKAQNSLVWHREVFGWLEKYVGKGATK